jgi:uncharacterized protein YdiU (UPF0061 family)
MEEFMKIRIMDVDKTPFWGIPEAEIHLSEEDNGFKEIDYSTFTPYQQQTLWSAIKMKTLEAKDDEQFQKDVRVMLQAYLEKRQGNQISELRQVFGVDTSPSDKQAVDAVAKAEEIKKVMNSSVSTLKKMLPDYSATDLELAYRIEQHGKNRKTVLKLINDLIAKQTKKFASKIESPNAPDAKEFEARQIFKGKDRQFLSNLSNVRESDKEEVVIKI